MNKERIICKGNWWDRWFSNSCDLEMIKIPREEWPNKVFKTPLVTDVYKCPRCHKLQVFTDWPGPY